MTELKGITADSGKSLRQINGLNAATILERRTAQH